MCEETDNTEEAAGFETHKGTTLIGFVGSADVSLYLDSLPIGGI